MLMMVLFTVAAVVAMAAVAKVLLATALPPIGGQFFQQGLEGVFLLVGEGLEQFCVLHVSMTRKAATLVEQSGQAVLGMTAATMAVLTAAIRYTKVFAALAAFEGIYRAVVVALGAGLHLITFHSFIHIKVTMKNGVVASVENTRQVGE